jgi:hypothetical protein
MNSAPLDKMLNLHLEITGDLILMFPLLSTAKTPLFGRLGSITKNEKEEK